MAGMGVLQTRARVGQGNLWVWKITIAPGETIGLMKEVDEAIESAGGWPMK